MKKFTLVLILSFFTAWSYGQFKIHGISWVNWAVEPDYADVTGYAENPYNNPKVTVFKAPATWTPVNSVASFDATWDVLGDAHMVSHPTNTAGGDLFDLAGDATFGASWKAVHDGENVYFLLKYLDKNGVTDAGTMTFEIMAQPTSPVRHEPTFLAAADSTADKTEALADLTMIYKNMAYARSVELGGGKALFKDGLVNEYAASIGVVKNAWQNFYSGGWGANEAGLEALLDANHFWEKTDGVIRAVYVMSLDGALSYPEDPANLTGPRKAFKVGETFAFDVKSNAKKGDANIEYFWSSDKNNGYGSNYYSGHVTLSPTVLGETEESPFKVHGISWVNWAVEPDYADVTGYAENPYDNPKVTVKKAPAAWTPVNSVASFDATWDVLGDAHMVSHPTNTAGGDLFDLAGDATFGASWKAVHDGENVYFLLKYLDKNGVTDAGTMTFEIMAQPTSPVRHEPTFLAAADSTADKTEALADLTVIYKNMAYARSVELGGGKALFKDGLVNEYAASIGMVKNAWQNFYSGGWGANEAGLEALLDANHFWDKTDGVLRAVLVMSFDGALSYPENPKDLAGPRTALKVGDTFAFDVKSNAKKGDANVEYFWSSDKNNGYGSNYYSGHLTLSDETIGGSETSGFKVHGISWVNWAVEPDYADVTGYAENPYNNPKVMIKKAPATWTPVNSVASFDATWDVLGDAQMVSNPTNTAGGDLFDLNGDATFGASWKGVHDGSNFYLLLKYLDKNGVTDAGTMTFEIMAQPTSPVRHEPTFLAAADSTADKTEALADLTVIYKNMAYARSVELGGGKALFKDGLVNEYAASIGMVKNAWQNFYSGGWGANEAGLEALLDANHFWDKTDGVLRAVLVMSFDGALSYPEDPANLAGPRKAIKVGDTFAFDVKSNAKKGDANVEYFWSSDKNNGYGSNYYSGHLTLTDVVTGISQIQAQMQAKVYLNNDMLYVKGSEPVNLDVYSVVGVRVKSAKNVSRLSMQDLQNGIYLVRINNGQDAVKVVKY